jgi:energy-coupling factor transporter ATP-binding protein EcfA2
VRFGELQVELRQITDRVPRQLDLPGAFSLPASLAFPRHASLLIHTDRAGRDEAMNTLRMVMARLLTSLPAGRVRFTIVDPVGLGQNFAGFMHLADHDEALVGSRIWTESEHIEQRLSDLTEHMETVIQKYLRNEFETVDQYNAQAGELAEPYRFLVIADFPVGFEGDSFRRLASIASSGARCGVYTLIVRDLRTPLPGGTHIDELEQHSINLVRDAQTGRFVWRDEVFAQFPLGLDSPPDERSLTEMLDVVGRHARDSRRVEVPFSAIAPREPELWSLSSRDDLRVPMGRMGATRQQWLKLGRGVAQHALVAGKTGSGKSTLLHAIVTNIALWYSPDEVELYLVDFKKGVEFKTYATHELPHARAIAVESDREFGLSVLQRIDAELTRRGELFRRAGVQDIGSYRRDNPAAVLPRTLLIIDEFQEFFSEDDKLGQDAAVLLDRLVRQGRAFGIHLLLGSQTISGSSGLSRSTIGQMAVRIALQMSEADSQLILGDANSAARLLSRPGEAIYNDAGGLVEGNSPFQIAWLPDEQRDVFLERIQHQARQRGIQTPAPVVFEGNMPAEVRKNDLLRASLAGHGRLGAPAAAPRAWLGEPVAIKDPTAITFRRQSGANALIVGQADEQAMALVCAAMISLASQHTKDSARFYVFDGTPADSPLAGMMQRVSRAIPQAVRHVEYRATAEVIGEIAAEVRQRQDADAHDAPALYVLLIGLQRYRVLRRSEEGFGFSLEEGEKPPQPDRQLAEILRDGPPLGVHVLCWCDTPAAVERTLDRGSLREFDHRVLFQMSAADSSNLIDSPAANKLGFHRALAFSEEQGVMEKFRPYALPDEPWLEEVARTLEARPTDAS